tara:strand:- start:212 stop:946 length:735 start_codon:yes stop_codon:yes gene_type:complete
MVNIDTVYQTVQALANKEQRGYLTPQEFNLFANQAQQDIFEQYFYDINAFREKRPQEFEVGNSVSFIMTKIRDWYSVESLGANGVITGGAGGAGNNGKLMYNRGGVRRKMKEVDGPEELISLAKSNWHNQGTDEVFYFRVRDFQIQVWRRYGGALQPIPSAEYVTDLSIEVIDGRPDLVYWGYIVVNEEALYNGAASQHFQLHHSEQADLVIKILKLAGIAIEDPSLFQPAAGEDQINLQQENK